MPQFQIHRFHPHCGQNIVLMCGNTVAHRKSSFANSIVFSEKPLLPDETFLLEITLIDSRWNGHMRFGVTQLDPRMNFPLPRYAVPDLLHTSPSWIFPVTASRIESNNFLLSNDTKTFSKELDDVIRENKQKSDPHPRLLLGCDPKFVSEPKIGKKNSTKTFITYIGSRIGVKYICKGDFAELHFIANGVDQGVFVSDIPFKKGPIFAVVDVFGMTKEVKIVQFDDCDSFMWDSITLFIIVYLFISFVSSIFL